MIFMALLNLFFVSIFLFVILIILIGKFTLLIFIMKNFSVKVSLLLSLVYDLFKMTNLP